jgi:hypothetical protein
MNVQTAKQHAGPWVQGQVAGRTESGRLACPDSSVRGAGRTLIQIRS